MIVLKLLLLFVALPSFAQDLECNWTSGEKILKTEHIERLVQFTRNDPESRLVLDEAMHSFGINDTKELFQFIKICDSGNDHAGAAFPKFETYWNEIPSQEEVAEQIEEIKLKVLRDMRPNKRLVFWDEYRDFVSYTILNYSSICISADRSLIQAYGTFIHELKHIGKIDSAPHSKRFLDLYEGPKDYVNKNLLAPGGELEAYKAGFKAKIKASRSREHSQDGSATNYFAQLPYSVQTAFNENGELINQEELIKFILDEQGYRSKFENEYKEQLISLHNQVVQESNFIIRLHNSWVDYFNRTQKPEIKTRLNRLKAQHAENTKLKERYKERLANYWPELLQSEYSRVERPPEALARGGDASSSNGKAKKYDEVHTPEPTNRPKSHASIELSPRVEEGAQDSLYP